jgi:hypothetical protein
METYPFQIDFPKAIQAVSVLLHARRYQTMDYAEMLRLLYAIERDILQEKCYPFIGDSIFWTVSGPVMKTINKLCLSKYHCNICDKVFQSQFKIWDKTFQMIGNDIKLIDNISVSLLSKFEVKKLREFAKNLNLI